MDNTPAEASNTLYGFTAFPYDLTLEAYGDPSNGILGKTYSLMLQDSSFFVLWEDACVPWAELATDTPINSATSADWSHAKDSLELANFSGPILLGLAPTQHDRQTINYDCASQKIDNGDYERIEAIDPGFRNRRLNDPYVMDLYLKYVLAAIDFINPKFILLGIEMSFPIIKDKQTVDDYLELHKFVYSEVKKSHPDIQITFANSPYVNMSNNPAGGTWGDYFLEINRDYSDFLGVSYYPHSSEFFEAVFLTDFVTDGDLSDRSALDYMESYSKNLGNKKVAILDTGIPSETVNLQPYFPIEIKGSDQRINQWTNLVTSRAVENDYIFVNWWNAYDFEPLFDKQPGDITDPSDPLGESKAVLGIWKNMGLWEIPDNYSTTLEPVPKEALSIWRNNFKIN